VVGRDDVAADGRRELWGQSWENGLETFEQHADHVYCASTR